MNRRSFLRSLAVAPLAIPAAVVAAKEPALPVIRGITARQLFNGEQLQALINSLDPLDQMRFVLAAGFQAVSKLRRGGPTP